MKKYLKDKIFWILVIIAALSGILGITLSFFPENLTASLFAAIFTITFALSLLPILIYMVIKEFRYK